MDTNIDVTLALEKGDLNVKGEFLWGSNYTFLAEVDYQGKNYQSVYKPIRGERPLWDFPAASLARRETAAYLVSEALGWKLVPPTVYRSKGPLGPGSLQLFIPHNPDYHYFNFSDEDRQRLRPVALFDLLINNADRKGSHILIDSDNRLWLIDHGVCFHVEDKLRTVVWDFVNEPIPEELCADLTKFLNKLREPIDSSEPSGFAATLSKYLSRGELKALAKRAERLISAGFFPAPDPYRRPFPWPQI